MLDIPSAIDSMRLSVKSVSEREYFAIHQKRYEIVLQTIDGLHLPKNAAVLDIGCYPLHLFSILKNEPFALNMYGISSRHEQVKRNNIAVLNIERNRFPFKSSMFDLVILTEVIEHMTANPAVYLSEIKRVLAPGGFLLVTTPNAVHLKHRINILFGQNLWFPIKQLYETTIDDDSIYFRHNREFTLNELKTVVTNTGFKIERAAYVSFYTPNRKGRKSPLTHAIGYAVTNVISSARDSLLILATRNRAG